MSITQADCITENVHVRSLVKQLGQQRDRKPVRQRGEQSEPPNSRPLAILSSHSGLDGSAVIRLRAAGAFILRTGNEALSRALEVEHIADAIAWAKEEARVTSVTLVGHSLAAKVPHAELGRSFDPRYRLRLHNERLEASKLKLKDDLARYLAHPQICELISEDNFELAALFYLQESGSFLPFRLEE